MLPLLLPAPAVGSHFPACPSLSPLLPCPLPFRGREACWRGLSGAWLPRGVSYLLLSHMITPPLLPIEGVRTLPFDVCWALRLGLCKGRSERSLFLRIGWALVTGSVALSWGPAGTTGPPASGGLSSGLGGLLTRQLRAPKSIKVEGASESETCLSSRGGGYPGVNRETQPRGVTHATA